ncbi:MAG TPA: response regulator, partial [Planctomycetes bacterium]|nr:response regulator [Planctomycetota bacterium]
DDEQRLLDSTRRILRSKRSEWDMVFANSVDAALEVLEERPVDAIVSDINMPEKDGFDLIRAVRDRSDWVTIPIVILTGNAENDLKRRALELGATDLLNKPVHREDLIARLGNVIRVKEYQDEIRRHNETLEELVRERTAQLEASQAELIWRLGRAGEFRDTDTGMHVVRVGFYSRELAAQLGTDEEFQRMVFMTAPLHDLGKIGIPDGILLKPGKLNEEDWVTMRMHARMGADILRNDIFQRGALTRLAIGAHMPIPEVENPFTAMAARIAEGHHERWDGTGYPDGVAGEDIPLEARIVSLADVYDALGSSRPYKDPFSDEEILEIIRAGRGSQFDPAVVDAFEACLPKLQAIRAEFADGAPEHPQADVVDQIEKLQEVA